MFYFSLRAGVSLIFAHTLNVAGTEDFNHPQICVGILEFLQSARASSFAGFIALLTTLLYEAIPVVSRSWLASRLHDVRNCVPANESRNQRSHGRAQSCGFKVSLSCWCGAPSFDSSAWMFDIDLLRKFHAALP